MANEIVEAVESAERELGQMIPNGIVAEVLGHSMRKLEVIKKPAEYLPILFKNELTDYYTRLEINLKGVANHVQCLLANPM